MFHVPKCAPLEVALETFELYANWSPLSISEADLPPFYFRLSVCTAPQNPSLACRVKLSFHSGKKLMKILHTEVLRA